MADNRISHIDFIIIVVISTVYIVRMLLFVNTSAWVNFVAHSINNIMVKGEIMDFCYDYEHDFLQGWKARNIWTWFEKGVN